jgi:hypothetical protein
MVQGFGFSIKIWGFTVRLGVLYIVQDMYSFLSEYFSTVVLAPHAFRCRAAQVKQSQGPTE